MIAKMNDADFTSGKYRQKTKTEGEFIVITQKIIMSSLTPPEEQLEKRSLLPDPGGYNLHPAIGAYSFQYCFTYAVITDSP